MRILIAEDDPISRRVLDATLTRWGHDVVVTCDGAEAWGVLWAPDAPRLAILDWMMPELDGAEICRRVRETPHGQSSYLLLLTAKSDKGDIVAGLEAGADDYITKPFNRDELGARLRAGERILALQDDLRQRVAELEATMAHVKQLQGILPICCYCRKVREDSDYWLQVETYISKHADVQFSHGICPTCWEAVVKPELDSLASSAGGEGAP